MATSGKRKNEDDTPDTKKPASTFWNHGLKAAMDDPSVRVQADDQCVIIKDKYPKARYHFLVMPKRQIANLKALTPNDIPLLRHMHDISKDLTQELKTGLNFRYGYHAIPSMSHVHLHVISQDFDSPSLKTKKHWNSFTSEYFIDSDDVIDMLDEDGAVEINTSKHEQMLKQNLKCHRCDKPFSTMPSLKEHLLRHIPKDAKKPS